MESATSVRRESLGGNGTLINQGVISADLSGQTLTINPTNFTNQGTLNAINGATLTLSGNVTNNGTIVVNASTLESERHLHRRSLGRGQCDQLDREPWGHLHDRGPQSNHAGGRDAHLDRNAQQRGRDLCADPGARGADAQRRHDLRRHGGQYRRSGAGLLQQRQQHPQQCDRSMAGFTIANSNGTVRLDNGSQITGTVTLSGSNSRWPSIRTPR